MQSLHRIGISKGTKIKSQLLWRGKNQGVRLNLYSTQPPHINPNAQRGLCPWCRKGGMAIVTTWEDIQQAFVAKIILPSLKSP